MRQTFQSGLIVAASLAAFLAAGCTIYPNKPGSATTTTSAEQEERLSWQMVSKQQWTQLEPLLAANLVWSLPGRTLDRDDVLAYLKQLGVRDFTIRELTVKPNGPDMTVTYTLELSGSAGAAQQWRVVSVWQQVKSGHVLILRSEEPVIVTESGTKSGR
jgi:Domain of unknown function (DUF4440)